MTMNAELTREQSKALYNAAADLNLATGDFLLATKWLKDGDINQEQFEYHMEKARLANVAMMRLLSSI